MKRCKCKTSWSTWEHDTAYKHKIISVDKDYYPNLKDINDYEWVYLKDTPPSSDNFLIKKHKNSAIFKDTENEPHTETNCQCVNTVGQIQKSINYEYDYEIGSDDIYYNYVVGICQECATNWSAVQQENLVFAGKSCQEIYDIRSRTVVLEIEIAAIDKSSRTALYVAGDHIFDLNNNQGYVGKELPESRYPNAKNSGPWYERPYYDWTKDDTNLVQTTLRLAVSPLSTLRIYKWNYMSGGNGVNPCLYEDPYGPDACSSVNMIAVVLRPENTSVYNQGSDVYYSGGESLVMLPAAIKDYFKLKLVRKAFYWACGPSTGFMPYIPLNHPIFGMNGETYDNLIQDISPSCGPIFNSTEGNCYDHRGFSLGYGLCPPSPDWEGEYTVPNIPDSYFKEHTPSFQKQYKGYWKRKTEVTPANPIIRTETIRYVKYFVETTRHATYECTHYCGGGYPNNPYIDEYDNRKYIQRELLKSAN